jgi:hypothetical protein
MSGTGLDWKNYASSTGAGVADPRTGKFSMDKVLTMAQKLFAECEEAARHSVLPEKVDRTAVSTHLAKSSREAWDAG